jgi:type IV secretory pathway TrbF-like protein
MTEEVKPPTEAKPGWKTTELWGVGTVAVIIQDAMNKSDDWRVQAAGCVALALLAVGYTWSRSKVKA